MQTPDRAMTAEQMPDHVTSAHPLAARHHRSDGFIGRPKATRVLDRDEGTVDDHTRVNH